MLRLLVAILNLLTVYYKVTFVAVLGLLYAVMPKFLRKAVLGSDFALSFILGIVACARLLPDFWDVNSMYNCFGLLAVAVFFVMLDSYGTIPEERAEEMRFKCLVCIAWIVVSWFSTYSNETDMLVKYPSLTVSYQEQPYAQVTEIALDGN